MFQNIELTKFISDMLTPVVMMSACGLFLLGLQNKYSNIIDRIRELNEEKRELKLQDELNKFQHRRLKSIEKQMLELLKRAKFNKNSILSIYAGMIFFMLTSLSIALKDLGWLLRTETFPLIIFLLGTAFVFAGTVFAYLEVRISYRVVLVEVGLD
ncbi:MAG: DUF2721 domain-containing protein [Candidatus Zixiibacteriota bacterium]